MKYAFKNECFHLSYTPFMPFLLGLVFFGIGILVLQDGFLFKSVETGSSTVGFLFWEIQIPAESWGELFMIKLLGIIATLIGWFVIKGSDKIDVSIDPVLKKVLITRLGITGKKNTEYRFDKIRNFRFTSKSDEDGKFCTVYISLKNGEEIQLNHPSIIFGRSVPNEEECQLIVHEANKLLKNYEGTLTKTNRSGRNNLKAKSRKTDRRRRGHRQRQENY